MKRLAVVMLVIALILIGITVVLNTCGSSSDNNAPAASDARYKITADNRIYFTNDYSQGIDKYGQYIVLNGYWSYSGSTYNYNNQSFYMSYKGYHEIKIENRN